MVSKLSHPYDYASPAKKPQAIFEEPAKAQDWLLRGQSDHESVRDQLRRLDLTLRQSKFQHKARTNSLPFLRNK